jgi:hypothetical protein
MMLYAVVLNPQTYDIQEISSIWQKKEDAEIEARRITSEFDYERDQGDLTGFAYAIAFESDMQNGLEKAILKFTPNL